MARFGRGAKVESIRTKPEEKPVQKVVPDITNVVEAERLQKISTPLDNADLLLTQKITGATNVKEEDKRDAYSERDRKLEEYKSVGVTKSSKFTDPKVIGAIVQEMAVNKKYQDRFVSISPQEFLGKVRDSALVVGGRAAESVIALYIELRSRSLNKSDALKVICFLGYFFLPTDLVPDILPGGIGYLDDIAALHWVISNLGTKITAQSWTEAGNLMQRLFAKLGSKYKSAYANENLDLSEKVANAANI
jgi:uncharacterized membrane protein YkvA (DUF1232 family)